MLHELAAEHFGLDTKVARTLAALVWRPGQLTAEFLAGRRARYVPPLRLYLSLSVVYFVLSALASKPAPTNGRNDGVVRLNSGEITNSTAGQSAARTTTTPTVTSQVVDKQIADTLHGNAVTLFLKRRLVRRIAYMKTHKQEAATQIGETFRHELPDALFLLVPGLAVALAMLYRGSGRYYGEHLVFALHLQAFSFAALTVGLLPLPFVNTIIGIAILAYLFVALRRVYGGSVLATTGKATVIVAGYGVAIVVIMAAVGMIAFLFS